MNLRERLDFLKEVNKELVKFRALRIGAVCMAISLVGLAAAFISYSIPAMACTLAALLIAITQFLSASIAARRVVYARWPSTSTS